MATESSNLSSLEPPHTAQDDEKSPSLEASIVPEINTFSNLIQFLVKMKYPYMKTLTSSSPNTGSKNQYKSMNDTSKEALMHIFVFLITRYNESLVFNPRTMTFNQSFLTLKNRLRELGVADVSKVNKAYFLGRNRKPLLSLYNTLVKMLFSSHEDVFSHTFPDFKALLSQCQTNRRGEETPRMSQRKMTRIPRTEVKKTDSSKTKLKSRFYTPRAKTNSRKSKLSPAESAVAQEPKQKMPVATPKPTPVLDTSSDRREGVALKEEVLTEEAEIAESEVVTQDMGESCDDKAKEKSPEIVESDDNASSHSSDKCTVPESNSNPSLVMETFPQFAIAKQGPTYDEQREKRMIALKEHYETRLEALTEQYQRQIAISNNALNEVQKLEHESKTRDDSRNEKLFALEKESFMKDEQLENLQKTIENLTLELKNVKAKHEDLQSNYDKLHMEMATQPTVEERPEPVRRTRVSKRRASEHKVKQSSKTLKIGKINFEEYILGNKLNELRVADLKEYLKANSLKWYGKKSDLIQRISEHYHS